MYVIYCNIMYLKFYLTFGALYILVLVFKRAKKMNISSVGRRVFWQLFLFSREKSCRDNDAKNRCPIYMLKDLIN